MRTEAVPVTFFLPRIQEDAYTERARDLGLSRSEFIRRALRAYAALLDAGAHDRESEIFA